MNGTLTYLYNLRFEVVKFSLELLVQRLPRHIHDLRHIIMHAEMKMRGTMSFYS